MLGQLPIALSVQQSSLLPVQPAILSPHKRFATVVLSVCLLFLLCFLPIPFDSEFPSFKLESNTHPLSTNVQDQWKTTLQHLLNGATPRPESLRLSSLDPDTQTEKFFVEAEVLPMLPLPTGKPVAIPKLQPDFRIESTEQKSTRLKRLHASSSVLLVRGMGTRSIHE